MTECKLCRQGDPSFNVRCKNCREVFHIHKRQLDLAADGDVVMADCPTCDAVNCWQKSHGKIAYSGPVVYDGQPVLDLRKKGVGRGGAGRRGGQRNSGASDSTRASRRGVGRGDQRSHG